MHEVTSCLFVSHPLLTHVSSHPSHLSGFDRDDEWGFRAIEPSRCCISSIALVLLKTGIVHHPASSGDKQVTIDYNQMATAQKLLLFWRKPAVRDLSSSAFPLGLWLDVANRVPSAVTPQRKCWWDGIEIELKQAGENAESAPRDIKLWARRVWTLELSLVRILAVLTGSPLI